MMKQTFSRTKTTLNLCLAGIISLCISTSVLAGTPTVKDKPKAPHDPAQFAPDPAKRLKLADFIKGATRLDNYLKNALTKANDADKKFLIKEKQAIEQQLANAQATYDDIFVSIDAQIKRLYTLKVFPDALVAQMHKNYLETEAGKAMGVLQNENKKTTIDDRTRGEIAYQLGIISHRDQVNFKSALRHYANAVRYSPNNLDYLNALGDIYLLIEDHGTALKLYKQIQTLDTSPAMTKRVKDKISQASQQIKMTK